MQSTRRPAQMAISLVATALMAACQSVTPSDGPTIVPASERPSIEAPAPSFEASSALASPSQSASQSASPSAAASICTSSRTVGTEVPPLGTLLGRIKRGRILFEIEAGGPASSGTAAYAVFDADGFHAIRTADWTMAHAIWSAHGGIVFDSERNDDRHLFGMHADGSSVEQLTNDLRGAEQSAALTGNGLVFTHYSCSEPRDLGLHTVLNASSTLTELTPDQPLGSQQADDQPTVSPDGGTVVFVRFVDEAQTRGALFSIPLAGGQANRLIDDAGGVSYPRFSPDGRSILFTMNDDHGDPALWLVASDGSRLRQLTHEPAGTSAFNGDWSPDGAAIAMEVYTRGWSYNELHVIQADGSEDHVLWRGDASTDETAETPDWGR